ncbi:hypothetical protein PQR15_01325 [Streptomyces lydicus]|nr:hypothetical protein [Streptomyces lydicus]
MYRFVENDQFNYEILLALGSAWRQGADVGEVLAAASAVARAPSPDSASDGAAALWVSTWTALARTAHAQAEKCAADGHPVSARQAFLRAAGYFGTALVAVDGVPDTEARLRELFTAHRDCFDRFAAVADPPAERVTVPYEDRTLPGYLFGPPGGPERLPTVIVNNGSDGPVSAAWTLLGAPAVARATARCSSTGPASSRCSSSTGSPSVPTGRT